MYGYAGKVALVDLTSRQVRKVVVPGDELRRFIGGRGLAAKLLFDLMPAGADPLGPENVVVFAVGPLNGTPVPGSSRWSVAAKSPLTGYLGSGNGGGHWGAELKWAGFDAIVVIGVSEEPCFLYVTDGKVEVLPATELWGLNTWETVDAVRRLLRDSLVRVACIGKAGENQVPISTVICDKSHAAGRGGIGAVLGSKKVKAVAVRGHGAVRVRQPEAVCACVLEMLRYISEERAFENYRRYGSLTALRGRYEQIGGIPAYNFRRGTAPHLDRIDHAAFSANYDIASKSCTSCPVGCWHTYAVPSGSYAGTFGAGPQASTLLGFGCRCGMDDLGAILKAQSLADQYGLDVISTEAVIAFAMECWEKGLLKQQGMSLPWGDPRVVLQLMDDIAERRGLGVFLGAGCRAVARQLGQGAAGFAPHVKGLEMTAVDVRAVKSWGVAYAVSSRGADHMRAYAMVEFGEFPKDRLVREVGDRAVLDTYGVRGKGRAVAFFEDLRAVSDSLELCKFVARSVYALPENAARLLNVVTGMGVEADELRAAGERIVNLERLFNLREGLKPEEDTLPPRMLHEPLPDGPARGQVACLEEMLQEYYSARCWDRSTGYPCEAKVRELGLEWAVQLCAAAGGDSP